MMTAKQIKDRINEFCCCFEFEYKGKRGGVDPISRERFEVFYGGEGETVDSIDKVMKTPFIDGKRIEDVLGDLEIIAI